MGKGVLVMVGSLALVVLLTACGGGGKRSRPVTLHFGNAGAPSPAPLPSPPPPPIPASFLDPPPPAAPIIATRDIELLVAGDDHNCVVRTDGDVLCWGSNTSGQLGSRGPDNPLPTRVAGLAGIAIATHAGALAAGIEHTCAITQAGSLVYCWGSGQSGELGNGALLDSIEPMIVAGISNATYLSAGEDSTCAITGTPPASEVWCWGNVTIGGSPGRSALLVPTAIAQRETSLAGARSLGSGQFHHCAIHDTTSLEGILRCWGPNAFGALGEDASSTRDRSAIRGSDRAIVALTNQAVSVDGGAFHTCAFLTDGSPPTGDVFCWGLNAMGQLGALGSGPAAGSSKPEAVYAVNRFGRLSARAFSVGDEHSCAIDNDYDVLCWGSNEFAQMGDPPDPGARTAGARFASRMPFRNYLALSAGGDHTCALSTNGFVTCWGRNHRGQLGRAPSEPLPPVDVGGLGPAP